MVVIYLLTVFTGWLCKKNKKKQKEVKIVGEMYLYGLLLASRVFFCFPAGFLLFFFILLEMNFGSLKKNTTTQTDSFCLLLCVIK